MARQKQKQKQKQKQRQNKPTRSPPRTQPKRGKTPPKQKQKQKQNKSPPSRRSGGKSSARQEKKKKRTMDSNNKSSHSMVIRRNAAPKRVDRPHPPRDQEETERTPLTERVEDMGGSHAAAAVGAGAVGNILGVIAVGQGWVGPKLTAGIMMGAGATATAVGWYWEADHVMAAGAGLTTAGAFSMTNQLAVDAYESMEKKAREKREKAAVEKAEKDKASRLAEARALVEAEDGKRRNGRRIVVMDENDDIVEYSEAA